MGLDAIKAAEPLEDNSIQENIQPRYSVITKEQLRMALDYSPEKLAVHNFAMKIVDHCVMYVLNTGVPRNSFEERMLKIGMKAMLGAISSVAQKEPKAAEYLNALTCNGGLG